MCKGKGKSHQDRKNRDRNLGMSRRQFLATATIGVGGGCNSDDAHMESLRFRRRDSNRPEFLEIDCPQGSHEQNLKLSDGRLDSRAKCNRALREPNLHVFAKLFENCLKRSLEAKALRSRRCPVLPRGLP